MQRRLPPLDEPHTSRPAVPRELHGGVRRRAGSSHTDPAWATPPCHTPHTTPPETTAQWCPVEGRTHRLQSVQRAPAHRATQGGTAHPGLPCQRAGVGEHAPQSPGGHQDTPGPRHAAGVLPPGLHLLHLAPKRVSQQAHGSPEARGTGAAKPQQVAPAKETRAVEGVGGRAKTRQCGQRRRKKGARGDPFTPNPPPPPSNPQQQHKRYNQEKMEVRQVNHATHTLVGGCLPP